MWQLVLVKEGTQKACVVEHEGNEGAFRAAAEEAVPYSLFKGWLLGVEGAETRQEAARRISPGQIQRSISLEWKSNEESFLY